MTTENRELAAVMPSREVSKVFYESGIFKGVQSEAQAYVKIIAGREMGLNPIQSMNSVYIVDNKIAYETKVFLSKIKGSEKYDYKILQNTDETCEIEFFKKGKSEGKSSFTFKDAAKAGLVNKDNYKKYPKLMLFYRAASNGIKMYCPDVLDGNVLYEDFIETLKDDPKSFSVDIETGEIKETQDTAQEQAVNQEKVIDAEVVENDFFNKEEK